MNDSCTVASYDELSNEGSNQGDSSHLEDYIIRSVRAD